MYTVQPWPGLTTLFAILMVSPARAETGAAAALFDHGRDAMKRGNFEVACAKFDESNRLEPAVGTELNLALCEEELGHELSAWRRLQHVIDTLPRGDDRLPIARQHRDNIDARLPRVRLIAVALPAAASISIGDSHLTTAGLGVDIPVERGEIKVVVEAPRHRPREYRLSLSHGVRETLLIEAGPPVRPAAERWAPAAARTAPPSRTGKTAGFVSLGVGGALLVAGATTGLAAIRAKHDMADECGEQSVCSQRGVEAAERGKALALASTFAFAAGALGLAAGTWLLLGTQTVVPRPPTHARVVLALGTSGLKITGEFP